MDQQYRRDVERLQMQLRDRRDRGAPIGAGALCQAHTGGEIREVADAINAGDLAELIAERHIRNVRNEQEHSPWKASRYFN